MTVMEKEDKNLINKKVKKKKKSNTLFYKLISFILIILTVVTISVIIYNEIFTIWYMLPIIIVSIIILFIISFILNKNKLKTWIKNIFIVLAVLIILFELLMLLFGTKTLKFLSGITDTGYRVESFGVYVLKESNYSDIEDLEDKTITYINHTNNENIKEALAKIEEEIDIESDYEDTIEKVLEKLNSEETDSILIDTNYEDLIKEEFEDYYEDLKLIETIDIVEIVEVLESDVDITKEPFLVYVSGIDTSGNVGSKARSDVNIVLAINPETQNILMINTPRDYYVTLPSKNAYDKLTHAGLYGIEESIGSLEELYDADIDYYARINFTSFIKIVDALDGIKVDVPVSFCEQDSNRSFASQDLICLNKGYQTLNGEQALALARHRKTLATGDRARGENQMKIMEAIINKVLSPKVLTKYSSLITALEGRVTTNMTTNEMYKFAKNQLKKGFSWSFTSLNAKGVDSSGVCYSTGSGKSYVMEPDAESLELIKTTLNNLMEGKEDILEEIGE